jgi:hypothetical protein
MDYQLCCHDGDDVQYPVDDAYPVAGAYPATDDYPAMDDYPPQPTATITLQPTYPADDDYPADDHYPVADAYPSLMHIQLILKAEKPKGEVTAAKKKVKVDRNLCVPPSPPETSPCRAGSGKFTPSRQGANSQPPSRIEKDDYRHNS